MPTYTTKDAYTPYHEFGIALTPGATVETPVILTEVKIPVATPEDYTIGEEVEIGSAACTGTVWGNGSDGLRIIAVTGTVPVVSSTITGALSGETQAGIPVVCCERTADTPISTPLIRSHAITSTGILDPQTIVVDRETHVILISEIAGGPITISNAVAGSPVCIVNGMFPIATRHLFASLVLTFSAAGSCRIQEFRESQFADTLLKTQPDELVGRIEPEWTHYTDVANVISAAQDITGSFADVGGEIDAQGYRWAKFWVTVDINDSTDVRFQLLAKHTTSGAEFPLDPNMWTLRNSALDATGTYRELNTDADGNYLIEVDCSMTTTFLQLQVSAGTPGASAGQVDACAVTKGGV